MIIGTPVYIDPSTIVGWREGRSFDVSAGAPYGFAYPKNQRRYESISGVAPDSVDYGVNMDLTTRSSSASKAILNHTQQVMESLQTTTRMDEPVTLYQYHLSSGDKTLLLHGALRLSCVSSIRANDRNLFEQVPATFFDGSPDEARRAMIAFQMEDSKKTRPLTLQEQVRAVGYMRDQGLDKPTMVRYMRWQSHPWYVDAMLQLDVTDTDADLDAKDDAIREEERAEMFVKTRTSTLYETSLRKALEVRTGKVFKRPTSSSPVVRVVRRAMKGVHDVADKLARCEQTDGVEEAMSALQTLASAYGEFKALVVDTERSS